MKSTDTYKKVFNYIYNYQKLKGYSPSLKEIKEAEAVNLKSLRGVSIQLEKLQRLGYIERAEGSRRAIRLLYDPPQKKTEELVKVPIVGEIKAGYNAFAEQNIEGYKEIPLLLTKGRRDVFILRVKGTSMIKAGINPGDLAIIAPQSTANNGDIVVAFDPNDETATLKRFKKLRDYVMLLPESDDPAHQPKIGKQFAIQGRFIDLLRKG